MKKISGLLLIMLLFFACNQPALEEKPLDYALVIHGGAGVILKENMPTELEQKYIEKLNEALELGKELLEEGKPAIDVVEQVIHVMEESPLFNAGRGAVFTHDGINELDASIMNGKDLNAGAVAGVCNVKSPISLAKNVMLNSEHVMLSGKGASDFAVEQGMEMVDSSYFFTDRRWAALQKVLQREKDKKYGTVGCCVLDKEGNLAAGTSTGGMTNKRYNRIGDAPIIGAGTYANNKTCAVSATGHGEFFIRYTVAHDISALMEYQGLSLHEAAQEVVMSKLVEAKGDGGIIALDRKGNVAMVFNTPGMYRAYLNSKDERVIGIYGENLPLAE